MKLYLLPGTLCDEALWQGLRESLPDSFELVHVPIEQCASADEVMALISGLCTERIHLAGFSMGGYLALQYCLQQPARVQSLIVIAASAAGLDEAEKDARQKILRWLQDNPYQGMTRKRLREFVHPDRLDDRYVVETIRQMEARLGQETLISQMAGLSDRRTLTGELSRIHCPVLLVGADGDQKVPLNSMRQMHSGIPHSELRVIADCGHMIPLERPAALAALMREFHVGLQLLSTCGERV